MQRWSHHEWRSCGEGESGHTKYARIQSFYTVQIGLHGLDLENSAGERRILSSVKPTNRLRKVALLEDQWAAGLIQHCRFYSRRGGFTTTASYVDEFPHRMSET
jgi:hypothetical protein